MTGFDEIIGHEQIIEHFRRALRNHQISHAYILNGENGSGKNMLARAFAKALECEAGYGDSCNMCRSCHQFESGNHPDIKWLRHEKAASIGVDEVREHALFISSKNGGRGAVREMCNFILKSTGKYEQVVSEIINRK